MNLPDGMLSTHWLWPGHGLYALLMLSALMSAPWQRLRSTARLHVFLGTCVALMVLWNIKAGVSPGLSFHFLGATLLTLMFGWPLAVIAISGVLLAVTLYGMGGWGAFSMNALLMGALPASVSWAVWRLAERRLPHNLFIYIFVCAFFGAALAMAATGVASTLLHALSRAYDVDHLLSLYLPYYLLMVFPEAVITGSAVALLTVYRPQWLATYDPDRYLR